MRNRLFKSIISAFVSIVMVMSLFASSAFAVTQEEVDALRAQRDEVIARREAQQQVIDDLEAQQAGVLEKKYAMDERNQYTLEQIQLNSDEIALYDDMIEEKAKEVEEAKRLEQEQYERYRVRVRAMEENGNYGLLSVVLNSSNLSELLTVMDDVGEIMESDKELEEQYIAARQKTEEVKAEYEAVKADLEEKQAALRAEQAELEKQIEEAYMMLAELESDIEGNKEIIAAIAAEEDAARKAFDELAAKLEEERRQQLQQQQATQGGGGGGSGGGGGGGMVGTGQFTWPTPSCSVITSPFGNRWHPVHNENRFHSGVDIGAQAGASIVAADGGTVVVAGVNGGYGNCVMIDHGNGYTTLYGHMSSIAVSNGQSVSQGDVVGYVGSTGISTGPHLHFEVRSGGSCIDPMQFF